MLPPGNPRRLVSLLVSSFAISGAVNAADSVPEGWFVWPYVSAADGSALDTRELNHQPAGAHGWIVVRDGQFVTSDDSRRIRFWGCNISSNEAFPDADTANRMARRLAQGGVNVARLHHLDNPWSVDSAGSLWTPGSTNRINIDETQLDKLHRLVAALKAEGIYSNVNLKVSRTHTVEDGFPPSIADAPQFQKRLDYFQKRIVDLQKDYARQLLTTVNPYTGLSLAEDPAVAFVEINNENSLLGLRTRDIGAGLHLLPEPFLGELRELWNDWLSRRYADDAAIAGAWSLNANPPGETPLTPASRWHPDAQPGNEVLVESAGSDSARIELRAGDGVRWRSAAYLGRLNLVENAAYTVSFSARADRVRPVEVTVSRDEPGWRTDKWRTRGLRSVIELAPEWREFRFGFVAHSVVDVASRFSIIAGHAPGEVSIRDLRIEPGATTGGLRDGQSPRDGTVPVPSPEAGYTPEQRNDWLAFLVDVERDYVAEMRDYLRDELGVRVPIVCTQANYGGIAGLVREQPSDFIDAHAYWQHPDFGGAAGGWNVEDYTINNTPQIGEFSPRWYGELGGIALLRATGKPFSLSEVDWPAPSDYASEMYPLLATFGGLQDWDAIYTFDTVAAGAEPDDGSLRTFFDQNHHPAKWGFSPFASRLFRQGLVPPPESSRELFVSAPFWREANHVDVLWLRHQTAQDLGFLTDRLSVNENLLGPDESTHVVRRGESRLRSVRMEQVRRGVVYLAGARQAACLVGFIGGSTNAAGDLSVECDEFGLNFAAIGAVSIDERPLAESERVLVTLAARAGNQGMEWNRARTSVGDIWGKGGPTIAEHVPATIRLASDGPRRVFALAPDGSRHSKVNAAFRDGHLEFSTREGQKTLHYEIVRD